MEGVNMDWSTAARGLVGAVCGVLLVLGPARLMASIAGRWERWRLRHHHCPMSCRESIKCRCGCGHYVSGRQVACGLCGAAIVWSDGYEDDEYEGPFSLGPGCMNAAGSPDDGMDRDDDRDWRPYR